MHTTKHPKSEYSLAGVRTTADPAEQLRPLGKAYRLILRYDPQENARAQDRTGEATQQTTDNQPAVG